MYNINSPEGIPDNISIGKGMGCYGIAKFDFSFTDILEGQLCRITSIDENDSILDIQVEAPHYFTGWFNSKYFCFLKAEYLTHKMLQ